MHLSTSKAQLIVCNTSLKRSLLNMNRLKACIMKSGEIEYFDLKSLLFLNEVIINKSI